jgi:hypothetical protein
MQFTEEEEVVGFGALRKVPLHAVDGFDVIFHKPAVMNAFYVNSV